MPRGRGRSGSFEVRSRSRQLARQSLRANRSAIHGADNRQRPSRPLPSPGMVAGARVENRGGVCGREFVPGDDREANRDCEATGLFENQKHGRAAPAAAFVQPTEPATGAVLRIACRLSAAASSRQSSPLAGCLAIKPPASGERNCVRRESKIEGMRSRLVASEVTPLRFRPLGRATSPALFVRVAGCTTGCAGSPRKPARRPGRLGDRLAGVRSGSLRRRHRRPPKPELASPAVPAIGRRRKWNANQDPGPAMLS